MTFATADMANEIDAAGVEGRDCGRSQRRHPSEDVDTAADEVDEVVDVSDGLCTDVGARGRAREVAAAS